MQGSIPYAIPSLRSRRKQIVGLVVPSITNTFFAQMASEFETLAMTAGYDITIVTSNEDQEREDERIQALMLRQIDGLIVYPSSDLGIGKGLGRTNLPPTVIMDRGLGLADFDTVELNNFQAGEVVAQHLLEYGHRRFTIVVPNLDLAASCDRVRGIGLALQSCPQPTQIRVVVGRHSIEGARNALEQDLHRESRPPQSSPSPMSPRLVPSRPFRACNCRCHATCHLSASMILNG